MKITRIVKQMGRTIGTSNFGSIRVGVELEALVDESENLEKVSDDLFRKGQTLMAADLKKIREKRGGSK